MFYSYTVTITDHGSPALTTTVTLNIRHQSVFVSTSTVTIPTTTQDEWFYHPGIDPDDRSRLSQAKSKIYLSKLSLPTMSMSFRVRCIAYHCYQSS